ncbi:14291_t:CDS:2 [Rhizophagus irregularis]|nr:14291_t:CDS:2 [Rhizophagus irregularis]
MSNNSEINLSTDAKIKYSNGIGKKDSKLYEMIKKETNDTFISWLKSNEDIKYFEYSNFRNLKPVGKGSYGSVLRANMKNAAGFYALKSFNNDETTLQQIINENLINDSLISLNTSTNDENESFIIEFENDLIVNGQTSNSQVIVGGQQQQTILHVRIFSEIHSAATDS